jgi:DNA-binding NarL/FixJ family response regulator
MADDIARVLLIEDQTVLREALAVALSREPDIEVVGLAGTTAEARACVARTPVDVAVTELHLPDGPGTELIRDLRRRQPLVQVLVLTSIADRYDLAQALAAGAAGALHKTAPLAEIITAVRRLCAGQPVAELGEILRSLNLIALRRAESQTARGILARLTPRERDMLAALAQGSSDKEIAQRLSIGRETVHTHMVNLLGKLGVESRLQALVFAIKHGLVSVGEI